MHPYPFLNSTKNFRNKNETPTHRRCWPTNKPTWNAENKKPSALAGQTARVACLCTYLSDTHLGHAAVPVGTE
jgi:hypothetical protein